MRWIGLTNTFNFVLGALTLRTWEQFFFISNGMIFSYFNLMANLCDSPSLKNQLDDIFLATSPIMDLNVSLDKVCQDS